MKNNTRICILSLFAGICICMPVPYETLYYQTHQGDVSSVLVIDRCGGTESNSQGFIGKRKKFDLNFHRQLEQHFPDWSGRMAFQKKQEGFYKSAMQKKREALRLRLKENFNRTSEEQDAVDYFNGTDIYAKFQDIKTKPNIFDTRQSFLRKMHDPIALDNFLDSFNRINN